MCKDRHLDLDWDLIWSVKMQNSIQQQWTRTKQEVDGGAEVVDEGVGKPTGGAGARGEGEETDLGQVRRWFVGLFWKWICFCKTSTVTVCLPHAHNTQLPFLVWILRIFCLWSWKPNSFMECVVQVPSPCPQQPSALPLHCSLQLLQCPLTVLLGTPTGPTALLARPCRLKEDIISGTDKTSNVKNKV